MLRRPLLILLFAAFCTASPPALTQDREPPGTVSRVQGSALAVRSAVPRILSPGDAIGIGDILSTGPDSRLEILLADGTVFALGAEAAFVVVDFTFGRAGENNRVLRVLEGAFLATTAAVVGPVAENEFRVETTVATIGIRGTSFWGSPLDGAFQVMVLDGAGVVVATGEGEAVLGPGQGTRIPPGGGAPGEPVEWGGEKVERARATVAFAP